MLQQKDSVPFQNGTDTAEGLARCHMVHIVKPNNGTHLEYEPGNDIPTQGDKSSISCDNLSLRKYSRAKAHSHVAEQELKDCISQQRSHRILRFLALKEVFGILTCVSHPCYLPIVCCVELVCQM